MSIFRKDCPEEAVPDFVPGRTPDFPRFCSRCGSALLPEIELNGFDEKTGQPKYFRWLHCPKYTGAFRRVLSWEPFYAQQAVSLNARYTARLHPHAFITGDRDYLDCTPEVPAPAKAAPRRKAAVK